LTVSDLESSNDEGGHGGSEFSGDGGVDLKDGREEEKEGKKLARGSHLRRTRRSFLESS